MDTISEIIGNKKYVGGSVNNLNQRIILDQANKIQYENNLFYDISLVNKFSEEKSTATTFRVSGKINPIFCFDVYKNTVSGMVKVSVPKNIFDINTTNWSIVLLKSSPINLTNSSGNNVTIKGLKNISTYNTDGTVNYSLDLTRGLPAKIYYDRVQKTNVILFFPLGHNFIIGDKVSVTSKQPGQLTNGIYNVIDVGFNKITIDSLITNNPTQLATTQLGPVNILTNIVHNDGVLNKAASAETYNIKNLKLDPNVIPNIINDTRPKLAPFIDADYNVAKVVEKEQLEYFIKNLEVIDIIKEVDICGFALSPFNEPVTNWFSSTTLDLSVYTNHLNEPLTELYVGIIKNGALTTEFSNVESYFDQYIEFLSEGDGLEQITSTSKPGQKVKIGDTFFHSVCEYSTEQLTENEIIQLNHRFITNDVLFYYNPFYKKELKLKSSYIDSSDSINGIPSYAVYSRKEQKWIWREFYDIGITDENGNMIDFPFTNGSFYVHNDTNFFVNPDKNTVIKYDLNVNDVTASLTGSTLLISGSTAWQQVQMINDVLDNLGLDSNDQSTIKPYKPYTNITC